MKTVLFDMSVEHWQRAATTAGAWRGGVDARQTEIAAHITDERMAYNEGWAVAGDFLASAAPYCGDVFADDRQSFLRHYAAGYAAEFMREHSRRGATQHDGYQQQEQHHALSHPVPGDTPA